MVDGSDRRGAGADRGDGAADERYYQGAELPIDARRLGLLQRG